MSSKTRFQFSVVCSQRTSLHTVNNIYENVLFCLNICSIDFQPIHWKEQNILNGGKATVHKPVWLTKAVLERVSLMCSQFVRRSQDREILVWRDTSSALKCGNSSGPFHNFGPTTGLFPRSLTHTWLLTTQNIRGSSQTRPERGEKLKQWRKTNWTYPGTWQKGAF